MGMPDQSIKNEGKENLTEFPGKETTIDVPNSFSPLQPCETPQGQDTSKSSIGTLQISENKAHQTTGFKIDNLWATSYPAQQSMPPAAVVGKVPDLKPEFFKVACLVILISVGGILSVQAALRGERKLELTHNVLFKAYTVLNYISLVVGVFLFLLSIRPSNSQGLDTITKYTLWISLGSITYALACATSIILANNLVELLLILLAPLVMVFLLIILSYCSRKN